MSDLAKAVREATREAILEAAAAEHDASGCGCDRKYRSSCPRMAQAVLEVTRAPDPLALIARLAPADRLRYAARLEREQWADDPAFGPSHAAVRLHLALADWLTITARRMDDGLGLPGDYHKPLEVAAAIAQGAGRHE